ncbi:hypothetical protein EYF80_042360 [Liparis tanakae]|uniref:Uncharacterized protein n=1 Tax=Liparis tanakae TaxID=230148 RepID=A0A4Z2G1P6_9TELE|nr:hypothetical protein EYF80_042360 [Liparis tanakae]
MRMSNMMGWNIWGRKSGEVGVSEGSGATESHGTRRTEPISGETPSHRQRLLGVAALGPRRLQPVDEGLQFFAEGLHLGVDAVQQLVFPHPAAVLLSSFLASPPEHQVAAGDEDPRLRDDGGRVGDEPVDGPHEPLRLHADVGHVLAVAHAAPPAGQEARQGGGRGGGGGGGALGPRRRVEAPRGRQAAAAAAAVIVPDLVRVALAAHRALALAVRREEAGGVGVLVALPAPAAGVALGVAVPRAGPQRQVRGQVVALHVGEEHAVLVLQLHHLDRMKGMEVTAMLLRSLICSLAAFNSSCRASAFAPSIPPPPEPLPWRPLPSWALKRSLFSSVVTFLFWSSTSARFLLSSSASSSTSCSCCRSSVRSSPRPRPEPPAPHPSPSASPRRSSSSALRPRFSTCGGRKSRDSQPTHRSLIHDDTHAALRCSHLQLHYLPPQDVGLLLHQAEAELELRLPGGGRPPGLPFVMGAVQLPVEGAVLLQLLLQAVLLLVDLGRLLPHEHRFLFDEGELALQVLVVVLERETRGDGRI